MLNGASEYLVRIFNACGKTFSASFYTRDRGFLSTINYNTGFELWSMACKLYYLDQPCDITWAAKVRMGIT